MTRVSEREHSPWLQRKDWARSEVEPIRFSRYVYYAALCSLIFTVLFVTISDRPGGWIGPLVCGAVTLGFIAAGVYLSRQEIRFGRATLRLRTVPVIPGQANGAQLILRSVPPGSRFTCTLSAIQEKTYARRVRREVLWSETIEARAVPWGDTKRSLVAFEIDIPAEAPPSLAISPAERRLWQLEVKGEDLEQLYEIPVFASDSREAATFAEANS